MGTNIPTQPSVPKIPRKYVFVSSLECLSKTSKFGDFIYCPDVGKFYFFDGESWLQFGDDKSKQSSDEQDKKVLVCKHCGAPLSISQYKCDYCGSWIE